MVLDWFVFHHDRAFNQHVGKKVANDHAVIENLYGLFTLNGKTRLAEFMNKRLNRLIPENPVQALDALSLRNR